MYKYLLSTALLFFTSWLHPIHVSICEIEYDQSNKALEITMRIFLDDLEKEIRLMRNEPEVDITDLDDGMDLDHILEAYLSKKFKITLNDKENEYSYLGHEIEGDAVFCYMEMSKVKKLRSVKIYNSILTNLYEDQTNLVHVEVKGKIRSMKLTRFEKEDVLDYTL